MHYNKVYYVIWYVAMYICTVKWLHNYAMLSKSEDKAPVALP